MDDYKKRDLLLYIYHKYEINLKIYKFIKNKADFLLKSIID